MMKTKIVNIDEKKRRNRIFIWTMIVVAINLLQLVFPNMVTQLIAMVGTVYALYRLVVFDNKKNRLSRKYYDWRGRSLTAKNNRK